MDFAERIRDLTGGFADTDALTQWLKDGMREVVNIFPDNELIKMSSIVTTGGATGITLSSYKKVLNVTRKDSSGVIRACREIPMSQSGQAIAEDTSSLFYAAGQRDPVFYTDNGMLVIKPTPDASEKGYFTVVAYPTIAHDSTTIGTSASPIDIDITSGGVGTPYVFECDAAHGLAIGTTIQLSGFTQLTALNGISSTIASVPETDEFTLTGIISTGTHESTGGVGTPISTSFPDGMDYLVVLYAAIKVLQNKLAAKSTVLPSNLPDVVLEQTSTSLPTYISPDAFVMPVAPSGVDVDFTGLNTLDTFVSPVFTSPTLATIGAIILPSPPFAPPMIEKSVTLSGTAPTYTAPVFVDVAAPTISDLTISSSAPTPPVLSASSISLSSITQPIYFPPIMPSLNYDGTLGTNEWIVEEEDSEMLTSRVSEIQTKIGEFQAHVQNSLNTFQKDNAIYTQEVQAIIKSADLISKDEDQELQKYQGDSAIYQQNVQKEVQEYTTNMQRQIQIWTQESQVALQKYQADIQNQVNIFNKESTEYQAKVQVDLQDAQLAESREGRELQKYSHELQEFQIGVQKEIQRWTAVEFTPKFQEWSTEYQSQLAEYGSSIQKETSRISSDLQKHQALVQKSLGEYQAETGYDVSLYGAELQAYSQKFNADLQKNSADFMNNLQKYQMESGQVSQSNQSIIGKYGQDLANYGAKIQKHGTDYQWIHGQYQTLKADYNQGIQTLALGKVKNPQQQEGER